MPDLSHLPELVDYDSPEEDASELAPVPPPLTPPPAPRRGLVPPPVRRGGVRYVSVDSEGVRNYDAPAPPPFPREEVPPSLHNRLVSSRDANRPPFSSPRRNTPPPLPPVCRRLEFPHVEEMLSNSVFLRALMQVLPNAVRDTDTHIAEPQIPSFTSDEFSRIAQSFIEDPNVTWQDICRRRDAQVDDGGTASKKYPTLPPP